ncbi:MAG: hypothetical protein QXW70_02100 [Candidatus Anstonellales archaeon]
MQELNQLSLRSFRIRNNIISGEGAGYAACSEESRRKGGISGGIISRIITGRYTPPYVRIVMMAKIFIFRETVMIPHKFFIKILV